MAAVETTAAPAAAPAPLRAARPSLARAAAWMSGWLALMVTIAVAGREAARHVPVLEMMELRSVIGFVLLLPLVWQAGGLAAMRSARPLVHLGRNVVHYGAQFGWFYAVTLIPIGQVVAIEFTMPIWTALLAAWFLHERMNAPKIAAIVLGLVGVWMIVRPEPGGANSVGQAISLVAAVGFSIALTMVKSLTGTDSVVRIIFWMCVLQSAIGLVPAALVWRTPTLAGWPWIVLVAFCGTFSHYCMARAMRHADATVVVPMDFLRVPLTAIAGWLVYAEGVDAWSVAGALLILAGNVLNVRGGRRSVSALTADAPRA
ncbi:MAG TPA: DMT family transporter [Caldimonas sp.]|nr:DMT family transporter [Caldimonas sp.]